MSNEKLIKKIAEQIAFFKNKAKAYQLLFNADGVIDSEEQKELDKIQSDIDKIKKHIKDKPTTDSKSLPTPISEPVGKTIKKAVGEGSSPNEPNDVKVIQKMLEVEITGTYDKKTKLAILRYQQSLGHKKPDGAIDVGGATWKALSSGKVDVLSDKEITDLIDSPDIKIMLKTAHSSEGGYVDDPNDTGGKTKYGIAEHGEWPKFALIFGLDAKKPELIENITAKQVDEYYIRTRLASLSIPSIDSTKVKNAIFDQSILTPEKVKRNFRRALNDLGHSFPKGTNKDFSKEELKAINDADENKLVAAFVKHQDIYYNILYKQNPKKYGEYIEGWLNRTAKLANFAPTPKDKKDSKKEPNQPNNPTPDTSSSPIKASVGEGGDNNPTDVSTIQALLKKAGYNLGNFGPNKDGVDGSCGSTTIKAIKDFQQKNLNLAVPDGLVQPNKNTWKALIGKADAKPEIPKEKETTEDKTKTKEGEKTKDKEETESDNGVPITKTITKSVGPDKANNPEDVACIQKLLGLAVNGKPDTQLYSAILDYQKSLGWKKPDGVVDPGGSTWKNLNGDKPIDPKDIEGVDEIYVNDKANKVKIIYDAGVVPLNPKATLLIKSICAKVKDYSIRVTSTYRAPADQARAMYNNYDDAEMLNLYGKKAGLVVEAKNKVEAQEGNKTQILAAMTNAIIQYNNDSGKFFSKHMSGYAIDISIKTVKDSTAFYKAIKSSKGVARLIKYKEFGEKAVHIVLDFKVI